MTFFVYLLAFLLVIYCFLILFYAKWYKAIKPFKKNKLYNPHNSFSIIIPARNEEKNIYNCITSIISNNYPNSLYEIIVIDDFSTDSTNEIVKKLQQNYNNLQLITLSKEIADNSINSFKKKSIEIAISKATHNFIVCTDADCIVSTQWLSNFDAYLQEKNAVFVAAPVEFIKEKTVLSLFQYIDFLAMQAITAAAVNNGFQTMCNGANLLYSKKVFYQVGGFSGIDNIASGDDMLLMEKIKAQFPTKIGYLFSKESVVKTAAAASIKDFLNQRIRWASKSKSYKDVNVLIVLMLVYTLNLCLLIGLVLGCIHSTVFFAVCAAIIIKSITEYYFLYQTKNLFSGFSYIKFLCLQPFHTAYIIVAGWLGYFKKYQWKGRAVQ